jgi:hypothetical protein
MLKTKIDPEMYMKTKGRKTKWPTIIRAFLPGLHPFRENGRQSLGLFGRKCTGVAIVGVKLEPKSAHRCIGSSIHWLSTECFLDGAMIQCFDEPIIFPFHYILANKGP